MRRLNAIPTLMVDFSLVAGLAATGMFIVFGLIYLTSALGRVDPLLL